MFVQPIAATEIQEVLKRAEAWLDVACEIRVTSDVSYAETGRLLLAIQDQRLEIGAVFGSVVAKAHGVDDVARERTLQAEVGLVEAERILITTLADYHAARERLRRDSLRLEGKARERTAIQQRRGVTWPKRGNGQRCSSGSHAHHRLAQDA